MSAADNDRTPVTVLGLGAMGTALATTFLENGHPTTVWNRSTDKAEELVAKGAVRAASAPDAAAASPLVVLCVLDHHAVSEILDTVGDALPGRVLVNLTSGTPAQARAAARWAAEHGADYLDGGILADPQDIGTSNGFLLYSGPQDAFETREATLKALGGVTTYIGTDAGQAAVYFMALIGVGYETWISYLHTLALVGAENIKATTFAPFVTGMFSGMNELLTAMARATDDGYYPPDAGPLGVHAALMDDLIATRQASGIDVERLEHVKSLIDRRVAEGHGADGFSSLIETIGNPST
ncbi:MAG: NAD(P)-dependent oxidoreductase [Pseudonocardiaceae bacterium]|nr:NAD(P)-dependent oxidoreductase [Pseudonocardiaceae bacterium]